MFNLFYTLLLFFTFVFIIYPLNKFINIAYLFRVLLNYLDYKVELIEKNEMPKKIIIISSHTSIYDFFIGLILYYGYLHENYDTYVLMKKQFEIICTPILTFFDKRFKLISISKKNIEYTDKYKVKKGITQQICNKLKNKDDNYLIFIAPEGTRKCIDKLRSGYWYIAKELDIHIMYLGIDFSTKNIVMERPRKALLTWEEEESEFIRCSKKYVPLYPERCFWTKDYYNELN
jgi:1-acyl-sn-glycerol-3-phosphate acyltransferase